MWTSLALKDIRLSTINKRKPSLSGGSDVHVAASVSGDRYRSFYVWNYRSKKSGRVQSPTSTG